MSSKIVQGIVLLLGAVLVAGCAKQPLPSLRPQEPAPVRQEARLHLPAEPATLDSARAADSVSFDMLGTLMEGLVRRGEGGELLPGVAEGWESPDGRHFTFHLRKDARWSDGRAVTAEDFVYAWLRALDPQSGSDYAFLLYEIEGAEGWNTLDPHDGEFARRSAERLKQVQITAADATTLRVTLRSTNPSWAGYTAHPVFFPQRASLVARAGKQYGAPGEFVSNGPFMLERWSPGEELVLRTNLAYWDAGKVRLEHLFFRIERDGQAALRLYEMGALDQVVLPGNLAANQRGAQRMAQPSTMGLVFNTSQKRLANLNLRRAIHLAIDRKRLVEEVSRFGAIPSEGLVPPSLTGGWKGTAPKIPAQGDQLQARQFWELVRKELKVQAVTVQLLHAQETSALAGALQAMLQQTLSGLTVDLVSVPFEQRLEMVRRGQFDLVLQGWAADHEDPMALLGLFVTDGPGNDARWINREFDRHIQQARSGEPNLAQELAEAERILLAELPVLPLYHPVRYWVTREYLKGVRYAPLGARFDWKGAFIEK